MADVPAIPTSRLRLEIADTEGNLRGKYTTAAKLAKGKGATLSDVLYVLTIRDEVFESPLTGVPTGLPRRDHACRTGRRSCPCRGSATCRRCSSTCTTKDHQPLEVDPRLQLRRSIGRMHAAGFERAIRGRVRALPVPHRRGRRRARSAPAGRASCCRRAASGRPTACGGSRTCTSSWPRPSCCCATTASRSSRGRRSSATATSSARSSALPPLEAADAAARFKVGAEGAREAPRADRDVHREVGHDAVGLAPATSTSRCCATAATRSPAARWTRCRRPARHYLGGLIAVLARAVRVLARRTSTRYRRPSPELWAPTNASWGYDNRQAAVRAITIDQDASRLEYRRPGADLNPYLSIASCLDSGLHGHRERDRAAASRRSARRSPTRRSRPSRRRSRRRPTRSTSRSSRGSGTATSTSTTTSPRGGPRPDIVRGIRERAGAGRTRSRATSRSPDDRPDRQGRARHRRGERHRRGGGAAAGRAPARGWRGSTSRRRDAALALHGRRHARGRPRGGGGARSRSASAGSTRSSPTRGCSSPAAATGPRRSWPRRPGSGRSTST